MNRDSTVGRNVKTMIFTFDVPTNMCHGTYSDVMKLMTKNYNNNNSSADYKTNNNFSTDYKIHASIRAECISKCDSTANRGVMNHGYAYDIL